VAEHRKLRLPLFMSLRGYHPGWLRGHVIAGLTVWAGLVPEAIAYAQIAGLPPADRQPHLLDGAISTAIVDPLAFGDASA
jgi:Sulfate permease family